MRKYDFDVLVIGSGPAGMTVSAMASEMGLKVCVVEKHNPGGECLNVGCIPSKAIIKIAETNPLMKHPFKHIQKHLSFIREKDRSALMNQAKAYIQKGAAEFIDSHTIKVGNEKISAKRIFIATGTKPSIPPIEGIEKIDYLTNENLFNLDEIPESMTIIGGGAIGTEMAEAFSKLGCKCTIVHNEEHLLPQAEENAARELESAFHKQGIKVYNSEAIAKVEKKGKQIILSTRSGKKISSEKLLVAAGRKCDFSELNLEKAGIIYAKNGIKTDKYLRTSQKNIYAVGDCNGNFLLSHAAMHQGMIALMNSMLPFPFKKDIKKFPTPWTVFTTPEVSAVGMTEKELLAKKIKYEVIECKYQNYSAAIAEDIPEGYVKVFASKYGKIYGASIVGKNSGELINEWTLAIQNNVGLCKIVMTMHSFPTMGFLSKRVAEIWMMNRIKSNFTKRIISFLKHK